MKINPARIIIAPQISTLRTGANAFAFSASTINLPPAVNNSGADSSPPQDTGIVEIKDLFYSGTGAGQPDEYVVIRNEASFPIQLNDWTLSDPKDHISTFPDFVIQPDQVCRVDTNPNHAEWCGFNYGSGSATWNNTGDTAYLHDSFGTMIDDYSY